MIYIDRPKRINGLFWSHLIANNLDELHQFAKKLKLEREWFQSQDKHKYPHYDLANSKILWALVSGAKLIEEKEEFISIAKSLRKSASSAEKKQK